jgi:hypothetical protein
MAKAKLIKGQDYVVKGVHFRKGIALAVDDDLKEYLLSNEQFEIIEEDDEEVQDPEGEKEGQSEGTDETPQQEKKKGKGKQQEGEK